MKVKKILTSMTLALGLVLGMTACATTGPKSTETSSAVETATTVFDATSKTGRSVGKPTLPLLKDTRPLESKENTITDLNGQTVTYNMNTRKIVTIAGSQDVTAFGISLLAYEGSSDITGYEQFYDGAGALKNTTPFSAEEILSYEPELILVNQKMSQANIKKLSKIAPVIPLYTESTDFSARLHYIGALFGLEEHAKALADYAISLQSWMLQEMAALKLQDKTLTLFTYMGAISIPPERGWFMNTILYDYLALPRKENVKKFMQDESGVAYEAISAESLKEYEGDLVIYAGFGEKNISTFVTENLGWQSLEAVKEKRVGIIDITPYAQKGVLLLQNQYEQIYNALKVASQIK